MGIIGQLFKTIFNPSVPSVQSQVPTVTARDLVSETKSEDPEAPVLGSEKKNKNKGVSSLLVPTNDLYKGGMS